jgi:Tol biopolymer transport system component
LTRRTSAANVVGPPWRQLTFTGRNRNPIWTPDGRRIAFQSDRERDVALFSQLADGTGTAERLTKPEAGVSHVPVSWSPDGKTLLFDAIKDSRAVLWTLSLEDRNASRFSDVQSATATTSASFSHDGRWVAYTSIDDAAASAILVQPFPPTGAKFRIAAGVHPLWSRDDKELSYVVRAGGGLDSVSISTKPIVTVGNPVHITPVSTGSSSTGPRNYDRTSDDARFVLFTPGGLRLGGTASSQHIQVVLNWFDELKARVPTK